MVLAVYAMHMQTNRAKSLCYIAKKLNCTLAASHSNGVSIETILSSIQNQVIVAHKFSNRVALCKDLWLDKTIYRTCDVLDCRLIGSFAAECLVCLNKNFAERFLLQQSAGTTTDNFCSLLQKERFFGALILTKE